MFRFKADDEIENGGLNKLILKLWYKKCQNSLKAIWKICDFFFIAFLPIFSSVHENVMEQAVYRSGLCLCTERYVLLMGSINTDRLPLTSNSRFGTASCFSLFLVKDDY